jgi:hypothetical protein
MHWESFYATIYCRGLFDLTDRIDRADCKSLSLGMIELFYDSFSSILEGFSSFLVYFLSSFIFINPIDLSDKILLSVFLIFDLLSSVFFTGLFSGDFSGDFSFSSSIS